MPLSVYFERVGNNYEGHKYGTDELKTYVAHIFPQEFSSFALLVKNLL